MSISSKLFLFTCISFVFFILGIILAFIFQKRSKYKVSLSPILLLSICLFIATCFIFYPIYSNELTTDNKTFFSIYEAISLSIHNSMRLFVLDGDFEIINNFINKNNIDITINNFFIIYSVTLYILAPITVLGIGLSFFKNLTAIIKHMLSFKQNFYYMSELNEHSIILAEDIFKTNAEKKQIIFFNVPDNFENSELLFRAKALNSFIFKQDINQLIIKKPSEKRIIKCYFISYDEEKNLNESLCFINHYNKNQKYNCPFLQCYVFTRTADSMFLLDSIEKGNMKVRRVNENRNLILGILKNYSIFENYIEKNGYREINIMIAGLGQYGTELLKAICWCGQMYMYKLTINVFDIKNNLQDIISKDCPELIKYNGCTQKGEAQYNIIFHDNYDILSYKFMNEINNIKDTTMAFLMLGNDELNIKAAIRIRELFGRLNLNEKSKIPQIFATIVNDKKADIINSFGGLKNFRNVSYDINIIGNIRTEYSSEIIEQNEFEEKGLKCHLRWANTVNEINNSIYTYNKYEYYRKSSISEVLYSELRQSLNISLTDDKKNNDIISEYEHRRWNAYMRTEGYVYNKEKNDIAKTHPSLIPYKNLSKHEKDKDTEVLKASDID